MVLQCRQGSYTLLASSRPILTPAPPFRDFSVKRSSKASGMFGLGYGTNFLRARAEISERLHTALLGLSEVYPKLGEEEAKVEAEGGEEGWMPNGEDSVCSEKPEGAGAGPLGHSD